MSLLLLFSSLFQTVGRAIGSDAPRYVAIASNQLRWRVVANDKLRWQATTSAVSQG